MVSQAWPQDVFKGWLLPLVAGMLTFPGGCGPRQIEMPPVPPVVEASPPLPTMRFETSMNLAEAAIRYRNGSESQRNAILESLGGGVGVVDFDLDGALDLCFPGGGGFVGETIQGEASRLMRQQGPDLFEDVTEAALLNMGLHYSHGCAVADFNGDGFPDLLITGYGGLTLWVNLGDGTFMDGTAEAGLDDTGWSSSAAWGDFNGDGVLDLYVTHYVNWSLANDPVCNGPSGAADVCPPRRFEGVNDTLYLGQGDGTFVDASTPSGLVAGGKGLGVVAVDLDHDGDLDLYVANDTTPNFYYNNTGNGIFREEGLASGLALDDMGTANGSMGLAILDYDGDRLPDLGVTNYEGELFALYRNLGGGVFQHSSRMTGLNRIGNLFVGFGCVAGDFNANGHEDIAIANGHVVHHPLNAPVKQLPLLLANRGSGKFERIEPALAGDYFNTPSLGRGLATGDIDRDGLLDLVFVNTNDPAALLYNRSQKVAEANRPRGLHLRLVGTASNRDALDAWGELETKEGNQVRHLSGGGSYLSTSELAFHWHWDSEVAPRQLIVHWPSGLVSSIPWTKIPANGESCLHCLLVEPRNAEEEPRILILY